MSFIFKVIKRNEEIFSRTPFIIVIIITFFLGIIIFTSDLSHLKLLLEENFNKSDTLISLGVTLGVIAIFMTLVQYLNGTKEKISRFIPEEYSKYFTKTSLEIKELKEEVKNLNKSKTDQNLSKEEKSDIISSIIKKVKTSEIEDIYKSQTNELKDNLVKSLGLDNIKKSFERIIDRLENELSVLRRRSSINLSIGILITMGALYMLFHTIDLFYTDLNPITNELTKDKTLQEILILLLPRLSIVIFIEIFAFFFLRLYAKGLEEIKYFQNELTNIESKLISAEIAFITNNTEGLKESLTMLSKTERNFILKKGETTVELEKAKSESESIQNIMKAIPSFLKKKN